MTQTPSRDWQKDMFTYTELLAIWDGLNSLPRNSDIHHSGEKVSVEDLKKKVESVAVTIYPDTPRGFTADEAEAHGQVIKSRSKSTGINVYPDTPAPTPDDPNEALKRIGIDPTGWTWHIPAPKEEK